MAETLLAVVADKVLEQVGSLIGEQIDSPRGLEADLKKLHHTIKNVKAVILNAEEQQLTSRPDIYTWLEQLKEVLFDAEDVFDEFAYEAHRKDLVNSATHGGIRKKVRRFFSASSNPIAFGLRMRSKVREIREAFDEVAANKSKFHLNTHHLVPNNSTLLLNQRGLTHSFVDASQLIGRDRDRDTILASLLSPNDIVSVVSIIGMGGLGKTALAKMVFNDVRVDDYFGKKVWVCLGDLNEFSVEQVMIKIVKSITGQKSDDLDPDQLQKCLRENLSNKRFILVLDDVWVADRAKWLEFKELISRGDRGCKVMVTTRNSDVALNVGSSLVHNLKGLPHDQCVSLFKKFAFNEGEEDQNLMKIGDVIVGKCKGVPLAIKSLGCLLFSKQSIAYWENVRDSEIWQLEQKKDGILPALKISYDQLPFILKQCFLYCSIFPKDHQFNSVELIQHWSSHGLLRSSIKSKKFKDIGQQYINELYIRGFFQDVVDISTVTAFKMHDLLHDLALSVMQNELRSMKGDRQDKNMYKRIKHVSFSKSVGLGGEEVPKLFLTKNSRSSCVMPTIWSVFFDQIGDDTAQLVETCISELKHLRILDLRNCSNLERLPSSIGSLKHLRFLDLDGCERLKRLPDSICELYNLQSLSMRECAQLEELPKDIGDLVNLTQLVISTRQKRLSEGVGNGIESLSSLQQLVLSGCENLEYVFEPGANETNQPLIWTSLQLLCVSNCRSLTCLVTSTPSMKKWRELSHLETLFIYNCPNINLASIFKDQIRLVTLRYLSLQKLPQMELLPEWINVEGCATTLEFLFIADCPNLTSLPEWLSNLTSLRHLGIVSCPKLSCMPKGPSALKELYIRNCPELCKRCKRGTGEDWPKINHIPVIVLKGERL